MSTTIRTSGVVAALVLLSSLSSRSHATTLGETGAAMGTEHALAGSGGPSAARSMKQVRERVGSAVGPGGDWKGSGRDGWGRASSASRGNGSQTWSTGGWKTSGASSHR